jgi:predicted transposase YbfD/YdcC
LSVCAVISGAGGWEAIEAFGKAKLEWLQRFLPYANGIAGHDCIAWVMARLSPTAFQECFAAWVRSVADLTEGEVVAIDGKTLRRSYDRRTGRGALHMVSAWATANRLSLGQVATAEKSNEITAIPKLLQLLELNGCIVSIDAMGCQRAIAKQITEQGAGYVLALKENQPQLSQAVRDFFETAKAVAFRDLKVATHQETDAGHGRVEVRRYWLVNDLSTLPEPRRWSGLQGIGLAERECHVGQQVSLERRYYLTTLSRNAKAFANAVRSHWGIENQLHWVLDVTFGEDDSRIRRGHAPANFNTLRQIGINLLKRHPANLSIKRKRFMAALDDEFRANVVFQQ